MTPLSRSRPYLAPLLAFIVFLGVVYLRALPAWFRGSYTTEGGVWLSQLWQLGFLKSLPAIRPDYCVFGNLVVMQLADWINALLHGANLDHAASIQHHAACVYTALMFVLIFAVLRRSHGTGTSLAVCGAMLLMPDLDGENRIFGEVTNLGYFSALVTLFIYHDLWVNPDVSRRRLALYLLAVLFHIATSPLAGMITLAFAGLLALREGLSWLRARDGIRPRVLKLLPHLPAVAFAVFTVLRAQRNNPYAHFAADPAQLKARLVEVVLCRQILYPVVLNFYTWFNDARTLGATALLLAAVLAWVALEWKKRRPFETARVTGLLVLLGAALGMSAATALSRQWLILRDESYGSVWPARYYLGQNMVMGAFFALALARIAGLLPRARTPLVVLGALTLANYASLQQGKIESYLRQDDPSILARHWPHQLRRTHAMQSLTGDRERALQPGRSGLFHTVEINIENHAMQLAPAKLEQAAATRLEYPPDACPVDFADTAKFRADANARVRDLAVQNVRAIPRPGGVLVSFDALLRDVPYFSSARRHLWLGQLPGKVEARGFAYALPKAADPAGEHRGNRRASNWLFKVLLFINDARPLPELEKQLAGLPCALGGAPDQFIARGSVLLPHDRLCASSILGDESLALALHPAREVFRWNGDLASLRLENLSLRKTDLVVGPAGESKFDETACLRYNPDLAGAVARRSLSSARAYFDEFGRGEPRQVCRYSATLDVGKQPLDSGTIDGIRVVLQKGRREIPPVVTCVLHGDEGRQTAIRLRPPDGGSDFAAFFLTPASKPPAHPVRRIEIEFEGVTGERSFQLREILLYQSTPSTAP